MLPLKYPGPRGILRQLLFVAADYGRDAGWLIEVDGRPIAKLHSPTFAEMFWYTYSVQPLRTTDEAVHAIRNFHRLEAVAVRSILDPDITIEHVLLAGSSSFWTPGTPLRIRALYFPGRAANVLQYLYLWVAKRMKLWPYDRNGGLVSRPQGPPPDITHDDGDGPEPTQS